MNRRTERRHFAGDEDMAFETWLLPKGTGFRPEGLRDITAQDNFDDLFVACYEGIYRLIYRIVGTREEAEDLAQEAFLRLHRASYLWREGPTEPEREHNARAWLYRVAVNLAYNVLRGRKRLEQRELAVDDDIADASETSDPFDVALRDDLRSSVRRILAGLPERQAQLLMLRYAGLSYRELAEVLRIAPGSVGTLLARAEAAFERAYRAAGEVYGHEGLRLPPGRREG